MKKLIASVLSIAVIMSLAACSGKQPETMVPESSETTAQISETTETNKSIETTGTTTAAETTTTAITTAPVLTKKDYVKNVRSKYKSYVKGDPDKSFYVPELLIKSDYAESVNNEIKQLFEGYKKQMKKGDYDICGTEYLVCLTKEGILSLVFKEDKGTSYVFHVYNIDVTTGEKVDKARLAEIAGVSDIKKAARDALQDTYNHSEGSPKFKNYKAVTKKGKKLTKDQKKAEASFGDTFITDNIAVGLTDEGKMFFVLSVWESIRYEKDVIETGGGTMWVVGTPGLAAPD